MAQHSLLTSLLSAADNGQLARDKRIGLAIFREGTLKYIG
jgi:hypothetical protein